MMPNKIFFFVTFTLILISCRAEGEEEDDDEEESSDSVSDRVSQLKEEGAEYLRKVMKQLQNDRMQAQALEVPNLHNFFYTQRMHQIEPEKENYVTPIYNISGPTPVPAYEAEIIPESPPPISLSKEELVALYEAAVAKATALHNAAKPDDMPLVMPEMTEAPVKPALQGQMGNPLSGYYYYYFPIKSFMKETPKKTTTTKNALSTTPAPQQLHATITMMQAPNNKSIEPLFMAISGFIGMALMFFLSVLFVPKFGKIRSKNAQFKDDSEEMATFAQIVLEAMAGRDCSERLACEITRVFSGLKANNKSLRVLEIILPPNLSQQISQIRKAAGKKAKCGYIPCKMKKPKPPAQKNKLVVKPVKKKKTPHDLWMKHFEKQKVPPKKQQQKQQGGGWNRKPPIKKFQKSEEI